MSVEEIERAVAKLSPKDFSTFRAWFAEMADRRWDEQIERDSKDGKLDALAEEARRDYAEGRGKEL